MKIRKTFLILALGPLLMVTGLVVYLKTSNLSEFRPFAGRLVSKLIKRQLTFEGAFSAKLGAQISVEATNVRLANSEGFSGPPMAEVDSISVTLDTWSLFSRPVRFINSSVRGGRLNLERNADGQGNWVFIRKEKLKEFASKPFPIDLGEIKVKDVDVTYLDRTRDPKPVQLRVTEGEATYLGNRALRIQALRATWGPNTLNIRGVVSARPGFFGSDLTVEGAGPDVSPLAALAKVNLPAGPYSLRGRMERSQTGFYFEHFTFEAGGHRLFLSGRLGAFPKFDGTDFQMEAKGPDLTLVSRLINVAWLPAAPFEISASLQGNPTRFNSDSFTVRLGESDLHGSFGVDLTQHPPKLTADLRSKRVDLTWLGITKEKIAAARLAEPKKGLRIPDRPLNFEFLKKLDGRLTWQVNEVEGKLFRTRQVVVDLNLANGVLDVVRAEGSRGKEEMVKLQFKLEPVESGYHIFTKFDGARLRPRALVGNSERIPRLDLSFEFDGTGRSLRELALNGKAELRANAFPGILKSRLADLFTADLLKKLAEALNPFGKKDKDTKLDCAVVVSHLEKGVAKLDALAVRTDTTTMAGDGWVQIENEELAFEWVAKPRQGLGLSASSLSEPYVKLGGTLADPRLEIKPISATVSTGLAVITFGLSIVAKGVWNRVSAEKDICDGIRKRYHLVTKP